MTTTQATVQIKVAAYDIGERTMTAMAAFANAAQEAAERIQRTADVFAGLFSFDQLNRRSRKRLHKRVRRALRFSHAQEAAWMLAERTQSFDTYYQRQSVRKGRRVKAGR